MAVDSTFEFEKRRNRPVKYDRELMGKTISAMQRVTEIRTRREARFHANRMKDAASLKKEQAPSNWRSTSRYWRPRRRAGRRLCAAWWRRRGRGPESRRRRWTRGGFGRRMPWRRDRMVGRCVERVFAGWGFKVLSFFVGSTR